VDLAYFVYFLSLSAGIFLLIRNKRHAPPYFWLGIYLLGVGLLQIAARFSASSFGSNMLLYLISIPITYVVIFMIFHRLITKPKIKKQLWIFFSVLFTVMVVQAIFLDLNKNTAISDLLITYNIAIVGFCLLYYFQMLQIPEQISPSRQGTFWVVSGFFFYFLLSFVFWMVMSWFPRVIPGLRNLNVILVIVFYSVLWIGIVVHLNEKRVNGTG